MNRWWQQSAPGRWLAALGAAAQGARVHPAAALVGRRDHIALARGARISARCVLRADGNGRIDIGSGAWLAHDVEIETETRVAIGAGTTVQRRCSVNGTTRIGAGCILAPDVFISSGTHPFRDIPHLPIREQERRFRAQGESIDQPVWVQDDCWVGVHAVIAPGVTVGKGSVVGANSVVTRDVPPYSVVAGSPARVVGQRLAWEPPPRVDASRQEDAPYILCRQAWLVVLKREDPAGKVRVKYVSRDASQLKANGRPIDIVRGEGEFTVDAASGLPFGACLEIADAGAVDLVSFESVAAADA